MRRFVFVVGAALLTTSCGPPKPSVTVPAPVVVVTDVERVGPDPATAAAPAQPTLRLPRNFVPTSYAVRLAIDPDKPTFDGSVGITGEVTERSTVFWLHGFQLSIGKAVARQGGAEVALAVTPRGTDLLEVRAATPIEPGTWTLELDYRGKLDELNTTGAFRQQAEGRWYVFTQLEAIYARRIFPCLDEPDVKVPWQLTLDVPKALVAVSNTPEASTTDLGATHKRVVFAPTKPLPSYLLAFAIGPFELVDAGKTGTGIPMRVITLAKRAAEGAWAAKTLPKLVAALEDWFGMPHPYEKLDVISIPITVGFGAMENPGLVTFTEQLILVDPVRPSRERQHRWVIVAAHEIAHQWFGNLVTMKFWDDIWLNEGFANWMQSKVTAAVDPTYRDDQNALGVRNEALGADVLVTARQVRQPIDSPDDILTAFDGITYNKGSAVLTMFERYVGAATFQQGVRAYLAAHANGNATSKDFAAAIAKVAGNDKLEEAFATFLEQPGAPELTATLACGNGKATLQLAQQRYLPPGAAPTTANRPWHVPVCVAYDKGGARAQACTMLTEATGALALEGRACPRWVMPNVEGSGYYRAAYTTAQVTALRDEAWGKLTWAERRAVFHDVTEGATTGKLPLQLALSFVPKLLVGNDRFTINPAVDFAIGFDAFVPDELRGKYEHWLRTQFGPAAKTAGLLPREADTLDIEATREALIWTVAWKGRDAKLVDEAVKLAEKWRELPQASRGQLLTLAVDARPAVFEQILKEVVGEPDRRKRGEMIQALASVRDPQRQKQALGLLLEPKLDIRESIQMLHGGGSDANRAVAQAFFREHGATLVKRLPDSETTSPLAGLSWLFTGTCKAGERDAIADYVTKTFAHLPGGSRVVKQSIEGMDQCIARRALVDKELRAWLGGLRLPKK